MDAENEIINKKSRGENWIQGEKDLFLEIIRKYIIIENKQTDTNTNKKKNAEWIKIQIKIRELTGRSQDIAQLKGFWK
ncbi:unnamed protein product [Colias eurytheme]|nr:unnamed protein product [Colias eurytheme]